MPACRNGRLEMGTELNLTLPLQRSSVREARVAVADLARGAGMAGDRIEDLRLAVSEAATNAIQHGHHDHLKIVSDHEGTTVEMMFVCG